MRDFAASYQIKDRRAAPRQGWRAKSQARGNTELFWKTLAIIVFLVAASGVAVSYWLGHCIQESLMGIAQAQEFQVKKEQTRVVLLDEQNRLLQVKRVEAFAAVKVGLYSPGKRQEIGLR